MKRYIGYLLLLVLASCGKSEKKEVVREKSKLVRYTIIEEESTKSTRRFAGVVESEDQFRLSFRVDGTLEDLYHNIGDRVEKGSYLGVLDDETYVIDLKNKQANYSTSVAEIAKAKSSLENAENEYNRIEQLYFEDSVAKSDYDIAKSNYNIALAELVRAEASLDISKAQLENSELQLSYTKLISSVDGYIVSKEARKDETINAGTPVYTISPLDDLKIVTALPESLITKVSKDDIVDVRLNTIGDKVFKGRVTEVGKVPVDNRSNYPVKVELESNDIRIKSGMSVKVSFNLGDEDKKMFLPLSSIAQDHSNRNYIYRLVDVKGNYGVAEKVYIEIDNIERNGIEIIGDIHNGDYIITAGVTKIKDGQKVRTQEVR